jgi:predicted translin family RNA/ssDNA-binding protein
VTICLQEYLEAYLFLIFLKSADHCVESYEKVTREALTIPETASGMEMNTEEVDKLPIPVEDYLLAIADFTGELMRYCINSVGAGHSEVARSVCQVVRQIKDGKSWGGIKYPSPLVRLVASCVDTKKTRV